jgi:hypothetical protein
MQVYSLANHSQQSTGHSVLGLLLVATLVTTGFLLLYWLSVRGRSGTVFVRGYAPRASQVFDAESFYVYSGAKRELRRLYKVLLSKLHRLGIYVPRGYTVSEVAVKTKSILGHGVELFARIYNRYMYSPSEPPPEAVEEARSLVEGESR